MQNTFEVTMNLSRKRSDIDIMANILSEARKGARKTRIMYRCNLSHRQLQAYLKFLLDLRLLMLVSKEGETGRNFYKSTTKGRKFLDAYYTLRELVRIDARAFLKENRATRETQQKEGK